MTGQDDRHRRRSYRDHISAAEHPAHCGPDHARAARGSRFSTESVPAAATDGRRISRRKTAIKSFRGPRERSAGMPLRILTWAWSDRVAWCDR